MRVTGINHIHIAWLTELVARCRAFSIDIPRLAGGKRPPSTSRGHWLYAGKMPFARGA